MHSIMETQLGSYFVTWMDRFLSSLKHHDYLVECVKTSQAVKGYELHKRLSLKGRLRGSMSKETT